MTTSNTPTPAGAPKPNADVMREIMDHYFAWKIEKEMKALKAAGLKNKEVVAAAHGRSASAKPV